MELTRQEKKREERRMVDLLMGAVERRVSNPRGSRIARYRAEERRWLASPRQPGDLYRYPRFMVDRTGAVPYGLYWNNRLLRLGKTVWTDPNQAIAAFNRYVTNVLVMLSDFDEQTPLPEELQAFYKARGHKAVRAITQALKDTGVLQVRELETIPMPPDEID